LFLSIFYLVLVFHNHQLIRNVISQYFELKEAYNILSDKVNSLQNHVNNLLKRLDKFEIENKELEEVAKDYDIVRKVIGDEQTKTILTQAKQKEQDAKIIRSKINYER